MTQQELAKNAFVRRQALISDIERGGDVNPTLETLGQIATALQTSVSELLSEE
jgi:DNA-binding XRE family transcriptional regulator